MSHGCPQKHPPRPNSNLQARWTGTVGRVYNKRTREHMQVNVSRGAVRKEAIMHMAIVSRKPDAIDDLLAFFGLKLSTLDNASTYAPEITVAPPARDGKAHDTTRQLSTNLVRVVKTLREDRRSAYSCATDLDERLRDFKGLNECLHLAAVKYPAIDFLIKSQNAMLRATGANRDDVTLRPGYVS